MNIELRSVRRELFAVVAIKIVLLIVLWKLCFSAPLSHHLKGDDIKKHLISNVRQDTQYGY